jgi:hypothetical protein
MGKSNDIPLYKRAHFRRTREVITEIANYEGINIHDYDLFSICVYDTVGQNQAGKNVSYNTDGGRSIFVEDNKLDIFEAPKKSNKTNYYGKYLFFIHNRSFDYYYLGTMNVTLDKNASRNTSRVVERAHFNNYGKYAIVYSEYNNHISKEEYGYNFTPGYLPSSVNYSFDSFNSRKHAYKTSNHSILRQLGLNITSTKKIIDNKAVRVNKKNKKRPNNKKRRK